MADSFIIRKIARLTISLFFKAQHHLENSSLPMKKISHFRALFQDEYRKAISKKKFD